MNHSCTFQCPENGWWICGSYDIETNYLHLQPLDSVEQYIELYNENNFTPMTPEQIQEAQIEWEKAQQWCNKRSSYFSSVKKAESYLQEISESEDVFIGA